jgi:hypothetical protein
MPLREGMKVHYLLAGATVRKDVRLLFALVTVLEYVTQVFVTL